MAMHTQMVSFTQPQIAYLQGEARRLGVSVAEVVRRIVDEHRDRMKERRI